MKVVATLLLIALAGAIAVELSEVPLVELEEPVSLGEIMAQAAVGAPTVRDLAFKLRNNVLAHRELTEAAHSHYAKSSCGTPLTKLEDHVARGAKRRHNSLRYAAVARRRCYQRHDNARSLYPKIQKWKRYRRHAIKQLQHAAKRYFKEDGRVKKQVKEVNEGISTVRELQTTLYGAASFVEKDSKLNLVSLIETSMETASRSTLSQQVYETIMASVNAGAPVDAVYRLVYGVRHRLQHHLSELRAQRERVRSSWISLKANHQARIDSLNVRISRARARQASIASFSGRNCRLAARAAYKASKASKALNPARIALENLRLLCNRESRSFNTTIQDADWELSQLASVADRLGVNGATEGAWYASPRWSKCVEKAQTRLVVCKNLAGQDVATSLCSAAPAPADKRECNAKHSKRYRRWLLKHGTEFGALKGKSSGRHAGYASKDADASSSDLSSAVANPTGPASSSEVEDESMSGGASDNEDREDRHSSRRHHHSSEKSRNYKDKESKSSSTRVSSGELKALRRRAALRAAKRARARAARAARRARRNRRRLERRGKARKDKDNKEEADHKARKDRKARRKAREAARRAARARAAAIAQAQSQAANQTAQAANATLAANAAAAAPPAPAQPQAPSTTPASPAGAPAGPAF